MDKWKPFEKHYFDCGCDVPEHVLRFVYDDMEGDLWTEVHLPKDTLLRRVKYALRYVLGLFPNDGAWTCTLLRREDYPRLKQLLERSEAAYVAAEEREKK